MAFLFLFRRSCLLFWTAFLFPACCLAQQTQVRGTVTDAGNGRPLFGVSVNFMGTDVGTSTDSLGHFTLSAPDSYNRLTVSAIGYQTLIRIITSGTDNEIRVKLVKKQTVLREVAIQARNNKHYRNKDNPAVELIRRVIAHKDSNRIARANYVQYDQYERISLSLFNIPPLLVNNFLFRPYRFMLDTIKGKLSAEVYLSEKRYRQYLRKQPEKSIRILETQKESNIIQFLDTAGINIYLNRLYGDK
ncbi:MAG TPA: carboxypeptidase-like regulatory domain-containing protein, partial [Mucilaginibacter sp.]